MMDWSHILSKSALTEFQPRHKPKIGVCIRLFFFKFPISAHISMFCQYQFFIRFSASVKKCSSSRSFSYKIPTQGEASLPTLQQHCSHCLASPDLHTLRSCAPWTKGLFRPNQSWWFLKQWKRWTEEFLVSFPLFLSILFEWNRQWWC